MALIRLLDISGIFFPIWRAKESANRPIGEAAAETVQALRERAAAGDADHVVACCDMPGRTFRHDVAEEYRTLAPEFKGYKAHRPAKDPAMMAALARVIDELEQDGVPVMRAEGFEADDVIATITHWATANGHDMEIVSDDKDLTSLIVDPDPDNDAAPSVVVVRRDGTRQDGDACVARIGVPPALVPAFLAMAGDTSDGVIGIPSVGKKTAIELLWGQYVNGEWQRTPYRRFDDIVSAAIEDQAAVEQSEREIAEARVCKNVHRGVKKGVTDDVIAEKLGITLDAVERHKGMPEPARLPPEYKPRFADNVRKSIITNAAAYDIGLRLTTLRTDVPLDMAAVTAPRVPRPKAQDDGWKERGDRAERVAIPAGEEPVVDFGDFNEEQEPIMSEPTETRVIQPAPAAIAEPVSAPRIEVVPDVGVGLVAPGPEPKQPAAMVLARAENNHAKLARYVLEPRNYAEARIAAEDAAESRLYKGITTPMEALQVIMKGRKYGLTVADSLQMIHMIEGKPSMSAQLIIGLVMSSGYAEWIDFTDVTDTSATWETKRRGGRRPMRWSFTVDDARKALLGGVQVDKAGSYSGFDPKSNWSKHPKVMCLWRSGVFLCRAVYTDIVGGLYMPDELGGSEPEIDGNLPTHGSIVLAAA
jgi:5'-3' exonuclease